jgi:hypothetical protein
LFRPARGTAFEIANRRVGNKMSEIDEGLSLAEAVEALKKSVDDMKVEYETLVRLEAKLAQIQEDLPSNVIPLQRTKSSALSSVPEKRWTLRLDCLIEGAFVSEIHKLALELHGQSHRYVFMEYRDLSQEARENVDELLSLGGISLFVPNILDLDPRAQSVLLELTSHNTLHRPLLMVGSTLPYADLRGEAGVNPDLLALLSRAYIKLTRPVSEYKQQGLINYFLDSLSSSPT